MSEKKNIETLSGMSVNKEERKNNVGGFIFLDDRYGLHDEIIVYAC